MSACRRLSLARSATRHSMWAPTRGEGRAPPKRARFALLEDQYGVKPSDIHWIRGGLEQAGRVEKIAITLPSEIKLDPAPEGATLNAMLEAGEIDAFIGPRTPSCFEQGRPNIGWLWPEPMAVAKDYFRKTGHFPIMHMIGVR